MVSPSLQNPLSLSAHLIGEGAILTLPGVPLIRHLVVDVNWLGDGDATLLVLGEDLLIRGEYLRFDRLSVHSFGVSFRQGDDVVAVLTPINRAAVPEPEEYRQRLQSWRNGGARIPATIPEILADGRSRSSNTRSARGRSHALSL